MASAALATNALLSRRPRPSKAQENMTGSLCRGLKKASRPGELPPPISEEHDETAFALLELKAQRPELSEQCVAFKKFISREVDVAEGLIGAKNMDDAVCLLRLRKQHQQFFEDFKAHIEKVDKMIFADEAEQSLADIVQLTQDGVEMMSFMQAEMQAGSKWPLHAEAK